MKRCQAGTRNYEEANNLHAACYGIIGKLLAQQEPWCMKMNGCKTKCEDCPVEVAQPEQWGASAVTHPEYVAEQKRKTEELRSMLTQPKQEPAATIDLQKKAQQIVESKALWKKFIDGTPLASDIACWMADFAQQHIASPQRTWVGLTDEELHQICNSLDYYGDRGLVQLIEAKLKEKNT